MTTQSRKLIEQYCESRPGEKSRRLRELVELAQTHKAPAEVRDGQLIEDAILETEGSAVSSALKELYGELFMTSL